LILFILLPRRRILGRSYGSSRYTRVDGTMTRVREPVRYREAQENMQRIRFVLLVLVAAMLGALISMGDSSPGWDDTDVSDGMVLSASGPRGLWALSTRSGGGCGRWPSALAVGSWIAALGITLGHGYASVVALAFALVGAFAVAFAGAFAGRRLNWEANNAE
jgi:hypothetical protein